MHRFCSFASKIFTGSASVRKYSRKQGHRQRRSIYINYTWNASLKKLQKNIIQYETHGHTMQKISPSEKLSRLMSQTGRVTDDLGKSQSERRKVFCNRTPKHKKLGKSSPILKWFFLCSAAVNYFLTWLRWMGIK